MAGGKVSKDDEDEDESAPATGGPKHVEVGDSFRQAEPNMVEHGVDDQAVGAGVVGEQRKVEPFASNDDVTRD